MFSSFVIVRLTALVLRFAYVLSKLLTRPSLFDIRGPKPLSFLPVGEADFEWQNRYGNVVRFKTVFGGSFGEQLFVSDPKAFQRIFSTFAYGYPKQPNLRVLSKMVSGKGVVRAEGEDHQRQKKILLPGFAVPKARAFCNIFNKCAEAIGAKWVGIIGSSSDHETGTELAECSPAAFDVRFDTIQNDKHPLARANNIFGDPSNWIADHGSNPKIQRAREAESVATDVARKLVREKAESLLAGKDIRDIFSLLVRANMDADAKNRITEEESLAQMRTILLAGHETTSNSLSWILLELARQDKIQAKLRAEIREVEAATQFTASNLDAMPYTTAVIKEGLRYHPAIPHAHRIAGRDDILPLSRPIVTESGQSITEIVVPKGMRIVASIAAYNRNTELWGEDAHEFNPDRWLEGVANTKNLLPLVSIQTCGARACLGWRFAVIEIQAFLVELVGKFEFRMTDRSEIVVRRGQSIVMFPTVEGEAERGSQLPLAVSIAA
ncbi:cytochrome P450 [Chiua virens]|nr:cytochrome P450 [Chiua virens]